MKLLECPLTAVEIVSWKWWVQESFRFDVYIIGGGDGDIHFKCVLVLLLGSFVKL